MLRFGPLTVDLRLDAPRFVWDALARRFAEVGASRGPVVRIRANRVQPFHAGPGFRVAADGDVLHRHDFRVEKRAATWQIEAVSIAESVEAALRVVVGLELLERGGLLVHGASVVDEHGHGHLLAGASGAGKSTIAAEGRFAAVLCDELSIVAPDASGRFCVWPSPFWGARPTAPPALDQPADPPSGRPLRDRRTVGPSDLRTSPALLEGFWLLDGWDRTHVAPLTDADAALAVLARSLDLTAAAGAGELALASAAALVATVPVGRLSWRRGDPLAPVLARSSAPGVHA